VPAPVGVLQTLDAAWLGVDLADPTCTERLLVIRTKVGIRWPAGGPEHRVADGDIVELHAR
jgi:hypothetical protein